MTDPLTRYVKNDPRWDAWGEMRRTPWADRNAYKLVLMLQATYVVPSQVYLPGLVPLRTMTGRMRLGGQWELSR